MALQAKTKCPYCGLLKAFVGGHSINGDCSQHGSTPKTRCVNQGCPGRGRVKWKVPRCRLIFDPKVPAESER